MKYFYFYFFIISFSFSFLINALFLRFSKTLGIRDKKETIIRWASTSKPAFGGISFFIVFLISITCYSMFFQSQEVFWNKRVLGLLGTTTLAFIIGLADDAYNTTPILKLLAQIVCGISLCFSGIFIGIFSSMFLNYAFTVLWVVSIMNSLNLLDNMDAIAAIVSMTIFFTAAMLIYQSGSTNNFHFLILVGLISSLLGFICFNWHPSKLYMGDTGSQMLGLLLAAIGIIYFWNNSTSESDTLSTSKQLIIVCIAYILPITDTTTVIVNRILKKKSPFIGGRDHTTHNLFFRGVTEKRIALIFAAIGIVGSTLIFIIERKIKEWDLNNMLLFSIFPITIFLSLFIITKLKSTKPSTEVESADTLSK